jgi:DNA invertase Pin-like site-specific DNA recombinase
VPATRIRAAIYARVSSAAQRDRHTIENQLRALPAYAAAQGWEVAGPYVDDGRSAKAGQLDRREGFARLVRDAEAGRFDVLLVVDVDRLTRTDDMRERAEILGPFQRANIRIVTPAGGELDLRTFLGELYVTMQALVASEERRKLGARVKAGKERAIAEGRKPAGPTPYGLRYTRETGTWSIDADRAVIVREIFARVIAGESCLAIADDLHARGAPPPRGPWTRHKVWHLVRSQHAMGRWIADKRRRLGMAVPAIVDEPTWSAAQASLIAHGKRGIRRTRHVYLLEGLGRCGRCGEPMVIRSPAPHGTPAAYLCRARKYGVRATARCTSPIVTVADADTRVWSRIAAVLVDPGLVADLELRAAARAANRHAGEADVVAAERSLARLDRAEAGVLRRLTRESIGEAAADREIAAIARDRATATAQLEAARAGTGRPDELERSPGAWLDGIRELAADASPTARQRVVRLLLEPGGAIFDGRSVDLTLLIEASATPARAVSLAVVPGCRTHRVEDLKLRVVA